MDTVLTLKEFFGIHQNLKKISDTWSDLWAILHLSKSSPAHLLRLKFSDTDNGWLVVRTSEGRVLRYIDTGPGIEKILLLRRARYPDDVYVFQSHTNRLLATPRPVTLIAFNAALKIASRRVTDKTVSSKSAVCLK